MNHDRLKVAVRKLLTEGNLESDSLEYKKSELQKDKIVKTFCVFANNIMNRPYCFLLIGIEEYDDAERKGTPKRPILGYDGQKNESIENSILSLIPCISPKVEIDLTDDVLDDRHYVILGVPPQSKGPFAVTGKASHDKSIGLKPGRYVRIERESCIATTSEEIQLLKRFAHYHFTEQSTTNAVEEDLDVDEMREYLHLTSTRTNTLRLDKESIMRKLNLLMTMGKSRILVCWCFVQIQKILYLEHILSFSRKEMKENLSCWKLISKVQSGNRRRRRCCFFPTG